MIGGLECVLEQLEEQVADVEWTTARLMMPSEEKAGIAVHVKRLFAVSPFAVSPIAA